MEHGLRTCWLSLPLAEALGADCGTRSCVYHVALLRFIGCTSDASETAALAGGDDVAFNATMAPMLRARSGEGMRFFVRHLAEDLPVRRRAGRVARALADPGGERRSLSGHCEVGARLATRLGMGDGVCDALAHAYERWDGKGHPRAGGRRGARGRPRRRRRTRRRAVVPPGWVAGAPAVLSQRRGHAVRPGGGRRPLADGERWLAELGDDPCERRCSTPSPRPWSLTTRRRPRRRAGRLADFTDLKSPFFRGHSTGVAAPGAGAAGPPGCPTPMPRARRAALVHDVGRVGVPSGIWDRPGPLTPTSGSGSGSTPT